MTNQPPPMPFGVPQPTPTGSNEQPAARSNRRTPWIAAVAILTVTALAMGVFGLVSAASASDARSERDDLRVDILDGDAALTDAETELADATSSLVETQELLDTVEARVDTLEDENEDLQADLTEAQDAVVADANPFATQAELDEFRVQISEARTLLTTAESLDELTPFFLTVDSDFNRLISLNVTRDLSECKTILANNGFATTIIVASSVASLFEFEPDLVGEAQAEIAAADSIAESVFDRACGPLPES